MGFMGGKVTAYIGLGSNQGDRFTYLQQAVTALKRRDEIRVVCTSPVYESEAHVRSSEDSTAPFMNAVVELRTSLPPMDLLHVCQEIERQAGRSHETSGVWEARTLDLDLLIYGAHTAATDELTVPHPRMGDRRFVLQPLVDISPDCWVPEPYAAPARELLEECPDDHAMRRTDLQLRGR